MYKGFYLVLGEIFHFNLVKKILKAGHNTIMCPFINITYSSIVLFFSSLEIFLEINHSIQKTSLCKLQVSTIYLWREFK